MLDAFSAAVKAALYVAALSAAGITLALASLQPSHVIREFGARWVRIAAIGVLIFSMGSAGSLIARLGGGLDAAMLSAVFMAAPGAALALQIAGSTLLLAANRDDAFMGVSNATVIALSFAFSGHAAVEGAWPTVLALLHVMAAAWWVGSLLLLRRACRSGDMTEIVPLLARFSASAQWIVAGLIAAGVLLILALVDIGEPDWLTDYVLVISIKLGVVVLVLALALYNRIRLTPRVAHGDARGASILRRTIDAELGAIAAVLIVTAILTTYFSPHA